MALAGKKVLITGSSHGIGAATAIAFAKDGCQVGVNYNKTPDGAQATAQEIEKLGQKTKIYKADVSDPVQCESMVLDFIRDFGGIDVLINNAGGALRSPGDRRYADRYWNLEIDLNNAAAYTAARAQTAVRTRSRANHQRLLVTPRHMGQAQMLPYAPAKAGSTC